MKDQERIRAYEVQLIHEALEKSRCTRTFAEVMLFCALMLRGVRNVDEWRIKNIQTFSNVTDWLSETATAISSASTVEDTSCMIELMYHVFHTSYEDFIRLTCSARTLLIGPTQYSAIIDAQEKILAELYTKEGAPLSNYEIRQYRQRIHQALPSTIPGLLTITSVESYELHADCLNHMLDNLKAIGTGFWKDMQQFRSPNQNREADMQAPRSLQPSGDARTKL